MGSKIDLVQEKNQPLIAGFQNFVSETMFTKILYHQQNFTDLKNLLHNLIIS